MQRIICALVMLAIPQFLCADDDDTAKEFKALQGKWKTVSMEVAGNQLPKGDLPPFTVVVGADGKSTGKFGEEEFKFTIKIDPKKSPRTIDNWHETGDQKGKKQYGIYKLEGDKWTVCITGPESVEADRPKEFTSKGSSHVIFVFEKVKEEKK